MTTRKEEDQAAKAAEAPGDAPTIEAAEIAAWRRCSDWRWKPSPGAGKNC